MPCLLLIDGQARFLNSETRVLLEPLIRLEVCFFELAKAAAKLNEICNDPYQWWTQSEIQTARQDFCKLFQQGSGCNFRVCIRYS